MANTGVDVSNLISSWNNSAHTYERRLGGSTYAVAQHILSLSPPLDGEKLVLDNCCGTGAFTSQLNHESVSAPQIYAIDKSPGMIEIMQSLITHNGWQGSVKAQSMDSEKLTFPDDIFDLSVTNFGIFFFPDPVQGAKEIFRTLKPGGMAFVTCWKEICFLQIFNEVQKIVQPAKHMVLQMFETWMKKETIEETMRSGGFASLEILSKDVMIIQKNMDELVNILTDHLQEIVGNEWIEEEKMQIEAATLKVMTEQRKTFVVDLDQNGKVGLPMSAWIAKGTK